MVIIIIAIENKQTMSNMKNGTKAAWRAMAAWGGGGGLG